MIWLLIALVFAEERPSKLPKNHVRGKQLYEQYCFQCHGALALAENELANSINAPPLAGRIPKEEYPPAITLVQRGQGLMPAYEMLIDKHDTKRILIYLSRLDEKTGLDPNPKAYEEEEKKNKAKESSKGKSLNKMKKPGALNNPNILGPKVPSEKEKSKTEEKE